MKSNRRLLIGVTAVSLVGVAIYFSLPDSDSPETTQNSAPVSRPPDPAVPESSDITIPPAAREASQQLVKADNPDPVADLHILQDLLKLYRRGNGGVNPAGGENEEIVAALIGNNPKRLAVIRAEHSGIDGNGRLLDRWWTPYWFHPISGKIMEIRSAGPDKSLFTADDITIDDP